MQSITLRSYFLLFKTDGWPLTFRKPAAKCGKRSMEGFYPRGAIYALALAVVVVSVCLMKFAVGERNVAIRYSFRVWLCNMNYQIHNKSK